MDSILTNLRLKEKNDPANTVKALNQYTKKGLWI
jgi:hypothetical protein